MSFGKMPIANGFLRPDQFRDEFFFNMAVAFCNCCKAFQLLDQPNPKQMFNENYAFFSGTSSLMRHHFEKFANHIIEAYLKNAENPFVVEIGSNDGIMLNHFSEKNIRHLGIEPSSNVAEIAKKNGITTIVDFFNPLLAEAIVEQNGRADAFIAANVMCHISDIRSIVEGIKVLLKPGGIVVFEDPYLGDVIQKTTYDQIYDEHVFLYSVHSVQYLFEQYDMELVDVRPQETHGGSMRYVIGNSGVWPVQESVGTQLDVERSMGLTEPETFQQFKENCDRYRSNLLKLLVDIKSKGQSIAGYAATSKSTTIINYCGLGIDHLDCIYDTTPLKHGKYSPGSHIPIVDHARFKENYPDYALLFGYNHEKEIMEKESEFIMQGGRWITYVPDVKVIE